MRFWVVFITCTVLLVAQTEPEHPGKPLLTGIVIFLWSAGDEREV